MDSHTIFFEYVQILTPILIPLFIFIAGIFSALIINFRDLKRKRTLEYLDKLINEFYGPLYILTKAGKSLMDELMIKIDKNRLFPDPSNENPYAEWRLWMEDVFLPINDKIEKIILEKGYIIIDDNESECLIDFLIHNAQWKELIRKWRLNDFTNYRVERIYPKKLISYAECNYNSYKEKQNYYRNRLINITKPKEKEVEGENEPIQKLSRMFESNIRKQFTIAKYFRLKKYYHNAMIILYSTLKAIIKNLNTNIFEKQLWEDYDEIVNEYLRDENNLFEDDIRNNNLLGIINYKIKYSREEAFGGFNKIKDEYPHYIMFCEKEGKPIKKTFELYEEVKILNFNNVKDNKGNWYYPCCRVCTQDNQVGLIDSKYLWFVPRDDYIRIPASTTKAKKSVLNEESKIGIIEVPINFNEGNSH